MSSSESDKGVETIVMVSVSDTSPDEEYRTPPEKHSHTLTSSNEGKMMDCDKGGEDEVDCGGLHLKTVDLSRDSDALGTESHTLNDDVKKMDEGVAAMDEDQVMEEDNVGEDGPVVKINKVSKAEYDHEKMRIFMDESGGDGCVRCTAECVCVSDNAGFETGNGELKVDKRNESVEIGQGSESLAGGACGGNSSTEGDADGVGGKEPFKFKEPTEEQLTENILKVLGLLAKLEKKNVYKEKVDILGIALKAGIKYPQPSWWEKGSDDDSD